MIKLLVGDNWEQLVDENGKVLVENHSLDAEEGLFGLGIKFEIEEMGEEWIGE